MKTTIQAVCVVIFVIAAPASIAQVYKCSTAGQAATYQDTPCANAPKAPPHLATTASKAATDGATPMPMSSVTAMSVHELADARQKNVQMRDRLQAELDEMDRTRAARVTANGGRADSQEAKRSEELLAKVTMFAELDRVVEGELLRRCPKGIVTAGQDIACRN